MSEPDLSPGGPVVPPGPAGVARAVEGVRRHQQPNGAIVASVDFPQYQFSWLRDGSFVSYALSLAGEQEAAAAFHRWTAGAIGGVSSSVRQATAMRRAGQTVLGTLAPPCRFQLNGAPAQDDWPNFQVDGYGAWLWAVEDYVDRSGDRALVDELAPALELTAAYVDAFALDPCYDCWEENGDALAASTVACTYAGLSAAGRLLGQETARQRAQDVASFALSKLIAPGGTWAKSTKDTGVDASLLWLALPFGLAGPHDEVLAATVTLIEDQLLGDDGGVRRYPADVYFGGGAWPLLSAWLGWYWAVRQEPARAARSVQFIESCYDGQGRLPEQVGGDRYDPEQYVSWVAQWGPPAADLAWSHAMYVVLKRALET